MAEQQSYLQFLLSQGIPLNEASQYLHLAAQATAPGELPHTPENYQTLANTQYANSFSAPANQVDVRGNQLAGQLGYENYVPSGTPRGTMPSGFNTNGLGAIRSGPVTGNAGLLGQIRMPTTTAPPTTPGTVNATLPTVRPPTNPIVTNTPPNNPTNPPNSGGLLGVGSGSGSPPWGGIGSGVIPGSLPPSAADFYSQPWAMGGSWAGRTSNPMYGRRFDPPATQSMENQFLRQNSGGGPGPTYGGDDGGNGDAGGNGNGDGNGSNGDSGNTGGFDTVGNTGTTTPPTTPVTPIAPVPFSLQTPGNYHGVNYMQTYAGRPAPYRNLHEQIADSMLGVQPIMPTFRNILTQAPALDRGGLLGQRNL